MPDPVILGFISDTHGLLRPQAVEALRGCDLILHAGDVGKPEILTQLRELAPVVAVRGNIDIAPWAQQQLPPSALVHAGSTVLYVIHDIQDVDLASLNAGPDIVITGHSHKPHQELRGATLFVNPGSAGPRRFKLPVTVSRLNLTEQPWSVQFIDLLTRDRTNAT